MKNKWEVMLEEDKNGDIILPFPEDMIKQFGWHEGDSIDWKIVDNGAILTNITAKEREGGKVV